MGKERKAPPACSQSDRELFLRYIGELNEDKATQEEQERPKSKAKKEKTIDDSLEDEKELFLYAMSEDEANNADFLFKKLDVDADSSAGFRKARPKKRKSGPDAVLDLHAQTLEMALDKTELFLKECRAASKTQVLIIHGKGSGILKEGIRNYLRHHPMVSTFDDAQRRFGGSGAALVFLK